MQPLAPDKGLRLLLAFANPWAVMLMRQVHGGTAEHYGRALQWDAALQQFNRIFVPEAVGTAILEIYVGEQFLEAALSAGNGCLYFAIAIAEPRNANFPSVLFQILQ